MIKLEIFPTLLFSRVIKYVCILFTFSFLFVSPDHVLWFYLVIESVYGILACFFTRIYISYINKNIKKHKVIKHRLQYNFNHLFLYFILIGFLHLDIASSMPSILRQYCPRATCIFLDVIRGCPLCLESSVEYQWKVHSHERLSDVFATCPAYLFPFQSTKHRNFIFQFQF